MSLWKAYQFETNCYILAKNYSILHMETDDVVSLDRFLELCAPLIGTNSRGIYIYLSLLY